MALSTLDNDTNNNNLARENKSGRMALFTRGNLVTTSSMVSDDSFIRMEMFMRGNFITPKPLGMGHIPDKRMVNIQVNGSTTNNMAKELNSGAMAPNLQEHF